MTNPNLETKLLTLPSMSKITPQDQGLFTRMFLTEFELARYPNSWSYMTQACRNLGTLGFKFWNDEILLGIGEHRGHYVLVNPLGQIGSEVPVILSRLASELARLSGKPVFLKHVQERYQEGLQGRFIPMGEYPWCEKEPLDDATYPEVIVGCNDFFKTTITDEKTGTGNYKLRARLRRFHNAINPLVDPYFKARNYRDKHGSLIEQGGIIRLLGRWSGGNKPLTEPYLNMVKCPSESGFSFVMTIQGRVIGFYVFDRIAEKVAGAYAMITDYKTVPGATEACYYIAAYELSKFGVTHMNLGGSETESLHKYKLLKLGNDNQTIRDRKKEHLVFIGQDF